MKHIKKNKISMLICLLFTATLTFSQTTEDILRHHIRIDSLFKSMLNDTTSIFSGQLLTNEEKEHATIAILNLSNDVAKKMKQLFRHTKRDYKIYARKQLSTPNSRNPILDLTKSLRLLGDRIIIGRGITELKNKGISGMHLKKIEKNYLLITSIEADIIQML